MEEYKTKHLEMIQRIIERMAQNSFHLKTWTMGLVVLAGSFAATGMDKRFFIIAFIPIIMFWILDTYYLQLERKYRLLYNLVVEKSCEEIDFSMNLSQIKDSNCGNLSYFKCLFSKTEAMFYVTIMVSLIIVAIILFL